MQNFGVKVIDVKFSKYYLDISPKFRFDILKQLEKTKV